MQKRMTRSEVPTEQTWRLADLYPSVAAWEAAYDGLATDIEAIGAYRGTVATDAARLLACLTAFDALKATYTTVALYTFLNVSTDGTSPEYQAAAGRTASLAARFAAGTAFIKAEILALAPAMLTGFFASEPRLERFRSVIGEITAGRAHALTPATEQALAALGEVLAAPELVYRQSKASDMTFAPVVDRDGNSLPMSFAVYEGRYERSADTTLRRNAYTSFSAGLNRYRNTYAATWATEVKKHVVTAKLRGYESATAMLIGQQEVGLDVYHNLHDIILSELAPHMRRLARLRQRVLGLDKLLYCDLEAPLADDDAGQRVTFADAAPDVLGGLAALGSEYADLMRQALTQRWVDWADNVGKSTGAFCYSAPGKHPYVLVTWTDNMRNTMTLAHELGHAVHYHWSMQRQAALAAVAPAVFLEAPSTLNELLVGRYIIAKSDDVATRRAVLNQFLATYHHNFVRHLIEGELQRRAFAMAERGQTLTADILSRLQGEILAEFWGDVLEPDEGARLTWMRQPHYYMGLYPYCYSAGLTIGTAVAQAIQSEGAPAVERWLAVLRLGGTRPPLELATLAGVDLARPATIRQAVAYVGSLVDELEATYC